MNLFDALLSLVAPTECLGCGAEGNLLCADCMQASRPSISRCYKCHAPTTRFATCPACRVGSPLSSVCSIVRYEAAAKDLIWKLKFGRAQSAAPRITDLLQSKLGLRRPARAEGRIIITHAPTATSRVRQRGYDQAALIARGLARRSGIPYAPLLRRRGHMKQVGASKAQRASQLAAAFHSIGRRRIQGAHVILVDDVVTTGATLEAAARVLLAAGVRRVDAVVFAQA